MLTCLRIENLAVVEHTELELGPGLNVVTGPTGAGKSILVAALGLVLGDRARPEAVRAGADRATIEGLFELGDALDLRARLRDLDLPADEEQLVIRRVVLATGRSRATVNGQLTTLTQLREIAQGLVDISSQHEHHTLVDASTHLAYLDAFADRPDLLERVGQTHTDAATARAAVHDLRRRLSERSDREDLLRWQVAEIDRLAPQPGELDDLEHELGRLSHAGALSEATENAAYALVERERPTALCAELARLEAALSDASESDAELAPLAERLASARTDLDDLAGDLQRYAGSVTHDPARQAEVEERMAALRRLARKHGGSLQAVLEHREAAASELAELDDAEERLVDLQAEAHRALSDAADAATNLTEARSEAAARLGTAITDELQSLGMGGAEVRIQLDPLQGDDTELSWEGARLTARGRDRAELLIAPNPGEPPRPLRKVASGGELSRSLLAIKRVLAGLGPVGLYVFDEVDAGVGGAVAEGIGHKLAEVASHHQVLCITHLPQIAAFAERHHVVHKTVIDERTHSQLRRLSDDERIEELARMLGGRTVTAAQRQAAQDLLRQQGQL